MARDQLYRPTLLAHRADYAANLASFMKARRRFVS